jgi:hypothetical protein
MAKLTEQEQQEIIRYVEADKPLPDKYRFLLFEDKREVELVWNGKTSEVCNIVLPFQALWRATHRQAFWQEIKRDKIEYSIWGRSARGRTENVFGRFFILPKLRCT